MSDPAHSGRGGTFARLRWRHLDPGQELPAPGCAKLIGMMNDDRRSTTPMQRLGEDTFLTDAGEMGELVRSIDWRETPLGPLAQWPQSVRTPLSICLNSRFPIAVYWGPEYLMLYDQSLVPITGCTASLA
jgi:hypothetical protein